MTQLTEGVLDTSVVIDIETIDPQLLPERLLVTSLTVAELAAGPHSTSDDMESARRQDRLMRVVAMWTVLPFDLAAARAYGQVYAATLTSGRSVRSHRIDLLIASIALANGLPLVTRNVGDFSHLSEVIEVRGV